MGGSSSVFFFVDRRSAFVSPNQVLCASIVMAMSHASHAMLCRGPIRRLHHLLFRLSVRCSDSHCQSCKSCRSALNSLSSALSHNGNVFVTLLFSQATHTCEFRLAFRMFHGNSVVLTISGFSARHHSPNPDFKTLPRYVPSFLIFVAPPRHDSRCLSHR